jgi:hypothetical protein
MNPTPTKPRIIIAHVEGSGTAPTPFSAAKPVTIAPAARLLGLNAKMCAAASNPSALFVSTLAAEVHVVPLVLVSVKDNDVAQRAKPLKPDFTKRSQSLKLTYMTRSTKRPQWIKNTSPKNRERQRSGRCCREVAADWLRLPSLISQSFHSQSA